MHLSEKIASIKRIVLACLAKMLCDSGIITILCIEKGANQTPLYNLML